VSKKTFCTPECDEITKSLYERCILPNVTPGGVVYDPRKFYVVPPEGMKYIEKNIDFLSKKYFVSFTNNHYLFDRKTMRECEKQAIDDISKAEMYRQSAIYWNKLERNRNKK
jgi:hypothetical protein